MLANLDQRHANVNGASSSDPNAGDDPLVHYFQLCALVITVYDHLLTLDREVEYVWTRRWSKSKALYIAARYFGDLLLVADCYGAVGLKFVGTGSMMIIIITQMIMQLRIKALYGPTISRIITVFWIMEVIAVLSLGVASLVAIDVHPVIMPGAAVCNPTYLPRYAFLFWVPVIVFETFLFSLALRIARQNYLEIGSWRGSALIEMVLKDNFIFFVCAFAIYVITATTWLTANPKYFTVPGSFSCSLTTIMGCRLILNLCQHFYAPRNTNSTPPQSIWAGTRRIRFVAPPKPATTDSSYSSNRDTSTGSHYASQDVENPALSVSLSTGGPLNANKNATNTTEAESYQMHVLVKSGETLGPEAV